jgi:hypothetical protein
MSRKSQATIGPNVGIPGTTESDAFQHERLLSHRCVLKEVFSRGDL